MEEGKGRVCVTGGGGFYSFNDYQETTPRRVNRFKKILEFDHKEYCHSKDYRNHDIVVALQFKTLYYSFKKAIQEDLSFLTNLRGASRTLQVFNADLNNPESFIPAIEGCIWGAIGGALGILKASISSKTVKRVVYTGSAAAIIYSGKEVEDLDESYWSDIDFMYKTKPFTWNNCNFSDTDRKSKQHEHELDVVTLILPYVIDLSFVLSFPLQSSMRFVGEDGLGIFVRYPLVHVDDVARAHIFLLEHPNPKGRFICSLSGTVTFEETLIFFRQNFQNFKLQH
ncbi:hypothetical protein Lal_00035424 [Lupinus albus]|nr:hypothetical protein Lal_00035424 [Lupinus albus]